MLSIKGIYDGKTVKPVVKIKTTKKYNVVITFLEEVKEPIEEYGLREFTAQHKALSFWDDKGEDLYEDFLPKKKK
jgi:hypothetical protein